MRIKIIAVNALIVAIVGLLSFLVVRSAIATATSNKDQVTAEAQNDVNGSAGRLQLDGLRAERWLAKPANEQATLDALSKASSSARGDAAQKRCDDLISLMKSAPLFERNVPTLVALVDPSGKIVGRNGSSLNRGDDMGGTYPGLRSTLASGQSGSDVWYEKDRYLASYVAVHDEQGKIVGALIIGRPLNDTLARASEGTHKALAVVVPKGDSFEVIANSAESLGVDVSKAKGELRNALDHQQTVTVREGDLLVAAAPLSAFEDGKRALLIATSPASLVQDPTGLTLLPILGATIFGIILVVIGGWLLGNYITRPISMLEEGLLAILNGQSDKRFELEHAELGGLAFRIDQLLNQLMGVEEDTTDAEGRVSKAPSAANFSDAMSVEDKKSPGEMQMDAGAIQALAAEPAGQYYSRIFREYIAAKKALGEQTDHITEQTFTSRIQNMEQDAAQKHGRPVRYQVQARAKEVVLIAVPL
jgi:hypothetical protein